MLFYFGKRSYSLTAALACGCEVHFKLQFKYGRSFANYAPRSRHAGKRQPRIIREHSGPAYFEASCWSSRWRIDRQHRWPSGSCGWRSHRCARRKNLGQRSTSRTNGEKGSEARRQTGDTALRQKAFSPQGCEEKACPKSSEVTQTCHGCPGQARSRPPASPIVASG